MVTYIISTYFSRHVSLRQKRATYFYDNHKISQDCHCPCTCHEGRGRSGLIFPLILYLGTRWRWVVSFLTWLFYARKNYSTHWREGWVGTRAGLDISEGSKISCFYWELNFRLSSPQPSHYTDWSTLAPKPCHYVNNFTISVTYSAKHLWHKDFEMMYGVTY